ncbi:hypothetical protein VPH35_054504 [Triticum aestivum]
MRTAGRRRPDDGQAECECVRWPAVGVVTALGRRRSGVQPLIFREETYLISGLHVSYSVCGRSIKGDKITSECPLTRRSQRIGGPIQPGGGGRRISTGDNHGECDVLGVVAVPGKVEGRRRGARLGACMCRLKCGSNLVILHDI